MTIHSSIKTLFPLFFMLFLFVDTSASGQDSFTREEAVRSALNNRPILDAARARIDAAGARHDQTISAWYPHFDVSASVTKGLSGTYGGLKLHGLTTSPFKSLWGASLNVVWTLYDFGRRSHTIDAARLVRDGESLRLTFAQEELAANVLHIYDHCLCMKAQAVATRELLEARKRSEEKANALFQAGLRSGVDAQMAQVNVLRAEQENAQIESRYRTCMLELAFATGTLDSPLLLDPVSITLLTLPDPESTIKEALAHRPEILALQRLIDAAAESADAAWADHLPSIRLTGSVGQANLDETLGPLLDDPNFYSVGVGIKIPLFEGFRVNAEVEARRAEHRRLLATLQEVVLAVRLQIFEALEKLSVAQTSLPVANAEVKHAKAFTRKARAQYESQLGSLVELAEAEAALARAQTGLARVEEEIAQAQIRLSFARGVLLENVLGTRSTEASGD